MKQSLGWPSQNAGDIRRHFPMDYQLIQTSLHEAGHVIVGKTLGRHGTLYLWRNTRGSPWAGQVRFDEAGVRWSSDERILVALAGTIAEVVIDPENRMTAAAVFQAANQQRTLDSVLFLSGSDFEQAEGFERHHVERAFEIVTIHSAEIVRARSICSTRVAAALPRHRPWDCVLACFDRQLGNKTASVSSWPINAAQSAAQIRCTTVAPAGIASSRARTAFKVTLPPA